MITTNLWLLLKHEYGKTEHIRVQHTEKELVLGIDVPINPLVIELLFQLDNRLTDITSRLEKIEDMIER